jgi:hypothetical protein
MIGPPWNSQYFWHDDAGHHIKAAKAVKAMSFSTEAQPNSRSEY